MIQKKVPFHTHVYKLNLLWLLLLLFAASCSSTWSLLAFALHSIRRLKRAPRRELPSGDWAVPRRIGGNGAVQNLTFSSFVAREVW